MSEKKRALILDTSAFIMGYNPLSISNGQFSVPSVLEELVPDTTEWLRCKIAEESGKLRILRPSAEFIDKIKSLSTEIGDIRALSGVDVQILALALQLKAEGKTPIIVSDDYSIQNIAERVGIEYRSLATFGIRYQLNWILCCPACRRKYSAEYKEDTCRICGTSLKRKPVGKIKIRKA